MRQGQDQRDEAEMEGAMILKRPLSGFGPLYLMRGRELWRMCFQKGNNFAEVKTVT